MEASRFPGYSRDAGNSKGETARRGMTEDSVNERKLQHVKIVQSDPEVDRGGDHFATIRLRHRALPEINLEDVDPSVVFLGKKLSFPLLISSMTGGDHETLRRINKNLALAAEATGVAMGVGSQRVMFAEPAARKSFDLRDFAPGTVLLANLGAVQLNYGFTREHCRAAISVVGADALCLHLNPLQEAVQPEGNTRFDGLARQIGHVAHELDKPVILKEVGAGLSAEDVARVLDYGVRHFDVAGRGGTSFSRVEHHRHGSASARIGLVFQDWGIPTPEALRQLAPYGNRITLIASGGVRTGIDMVKAIVLGATVCGMAAPFLEAATQSHEQVIEEIELVRKEFITAMFLLGVPTFAALHRNSSLLL